MELKRDEIIKALEVCTYGGDMTKSQVEVCSPCPYFHEGNCTDVLKENALSLIKELTEEKERLRAILDEAKIMVDELKEKTPIAFDNETKKAKADTVREMQERLKYTLCINNEENTDFFDYAYTLETIDQIAEEMIGGSNAHK